VFTYGRVPVNNWNALKHKLSAKAGVKAATWRLHDLRRTAATGMQKLGTRIEVIEQALNHTSGSRAGITGIYQRHDYRNESMPRCRGGPIESRRSPVENRRGL